jgi:hypothetical protein
MATLEDRVNKLKEESKKAKAILDEREKRASATKERQSQSAEADVKDRYAAELDKTLKNMDDELSIYILKLSRGDDLTPTEEKDVNRLVKQYENTKSLRDKTRKEALDLYYPPSSVKTKVKGPKGTVVTKAETVAKPATPDVVTPEKKPVTNLIKPDTDKAPDKVTSKETVATTINPVTGEKIKVSDIKPATGKPTAPATVGPNAPTAESRQDAAITIAAGADFGLSEALFKNVPSLKLIFDEYNDPKSGMTDDEFRKRIRNDVWFKKNSKEIKTRFVNYYNFRDLQESGQAEGSTDYEQQISRIERSLAKRAVEIGSAAASDPIALRKAAENLYITNREDDTTYVDDFLAAAIRPVTGMIGGKVTEGYSGQALQNYKALLQTARNNGFKISDILPGGANEQQVLSGIASGTIDINRVAQDARKLAAQGQPQYVRDLLSQGYDLAQVFAPYRQTMANILEIDDPNQIDLNDPTLRMAITDKGDMNVYDFKKALKADNRWQYTENARNEVSTAAFNVLRDFGFQG